MHPGVIRHPKTGRRRLHVNPGCTSRFDRWTELLDYLYARVARPEFTCRFRLGDRLAGLLDNRSTWHFAVNYTTANAVS